MITLRLLVPTLLIAFIATGCSSARKPTTAVQAPNPNTLPYPAGSTELVQYVAGYDQGYGDYLAGRSSINPSVKLETSSPRLHGYSDGAIRGLKDAGTSPEQAEEFEDHITSAAIPRMAERYGKWVEGLPKAKVRWLGF